MEAFALACRACRRVAASSADVVHGGRADCALMLRKDDPEFAEVVERAFHELAGSREIVAIHERWFMKPLPSGVRLRLQMSPRLEGLFRVQGLPSD